MKTERKYLFIKAQLLACMALIMIIGCEPDDSDAVPATLPATAEVFIDGFSPGLDFQAFGDSKVTAFQVDDEVTFEKSDASMRFDVPSDGDPEGAYAGGIFFDATGRDLSGYNVLSFWGRASQAASIQELGFGLFQDQQEYRTSITNIPFSTAWTQYFIILPDASKLTEEQGIFYFVDTPDNGGGYSFWIDDVKYENLGTIGQARPTIQNGNDETIQAFVGQVLAPGALGLTFSLPNGAEQVVNAAPAFFTLNSSSGSASIRLNETTNAEEIAVISEGQAIITAKLGDIDAVGSLTLDISEFTPAPAPERDAEDVISIFSDTYMNVLVDFYNGFYAPFQTTESADFTVNGDNVLNYINYNFVGIEFNQNVPTIDGVNMTHLHVDIYIPDEFDPASTLRINLRDFGADASFDGGDDSIVALVLSTGTTPALVQGQWISVDFDISGLANKNNLGQIVFDAESNESPRPSSFFVDNIYLYNEDGTGGGGGVDPIPPSAPAPTPAQAEADVISIYSDAYTDNAKDGFNFYGAAEFEEVQIQGDGALRYAFVDTGGGNFQVIEFGGANQVDIEVAGMTNFRFDAWFSNPVDGSSAFLMKVVDIPASGATEGLINVNETSSPAISQGEWLSFDIPITELETNGLGGKMNIQQVVIDLLTSGEVYLDNIYFYKETGGGGVVPPSAPAPTPTQAEVDVISVYSNAYTDIPKDGFNFYGAAEFEEVQVQGDGALRYAFVDTGGGNFQVIEFGGANQVDIEAAGMTNFRFDAWFSNPIDMSSTFLMKIVDIPASGATEALINVNSSSTPAIAQGQWLSFDIPITELESNGLGGKMNIQQVVIDLMTSGEVYLDNIYFYKESSGGGVVPPSAPAPTPTENAADVISVYSDAYTDVPKDGFNFYGAAEFEEVQVQGDGALRYAFVDTGGGNFQVIEFGGANQVDIEAAGMTNFRFDAWFSNPIDMSSTFLMKVVDIPASGATEAQINVNSTSTPVIVQGQWLSFDVPITELESNGLGGKMNIQQVVIDLMNSEEVYLDNIYFYKESSGGGVVPPSAPAPTPTENAADVISVYSDAYTDIPKDGFNFYGAAEFEEVQVQGDGTLRYAFVEGGGGNFQVIEFGGANQVDIETAGMTNFRFDVWFSNPIDMSSTFLMKVVDIPASGATEAQINVNSTSTPAILQGQWLSFDIPITELESNGLGGKMNIQQVVIDLMNSGEVYLDNIYFYK